MLLRSDLQTGRQTDRQTDNHYFHIKSLFVLRKNLLQYVL